MGGPRGGSDDGDRQSRMKEAEALWQQMEDNDTQAYLEAEKVLSEQQQPRARELVSQQREALLQLRERMRENR
ncbi:hypothetical protein DRW03_19875 [Corallococcus sp. H22C18031201]|nr:hypothetical protein DRW03_19875 [Corallococcus sp. H22C18031201]